MLSLSSRELLTVDFYYEHDNSPHFSLYSMLGAAVEERQAQRSYRNNGAPAETFVQVGRDSVHTSVGDKC